MEPGARNETAAIKLFLVDGEAGGARRVEQALEREGVQSRVEFLSTRSPGGREEQAIVDIDRLRALLLENQKLVTTGRLAASISHEINNPLESITNLLYLLGMETGLSPQGRGFLATAQLELGRVAQISKQSLNFNRETPHPLPVEPCSMLEDVLGLYTRRAKEKGIEIKRDYRPCDTFHARPGEIRQVFSNLVTNAIEATSRGGSVRVRVRAAHLWSATRQEGVRITIADTGSGIPDNIRRRLGEPFFTTKGQQGTGIGLWLSHTILERYGGSLHVMSSTAAHRHGTAFSVFLPSNLRPVIVETQERVVA